MKAIGFQKSDTIIIFQSEASLIGFFGATTGILLGIKTGYILTTVFSPGGGLDIQSVLFETDITFVWLSVFLSLIARNYASNASRSSPIVAIRRD